MSAESPEQNGTSPQSPGSPPNGKRSAAERGEQAVDHISQSVTGVAGRFSRGVGRLFSWVKEEAANIWDEAQTVRRGEQPTPPPSNSPTEPGAPKE